MCLLAGMVNGVGLRRKKNFSLSPVADKLHALLVTSLDSGRKALHKVASMTSNAVSFSKIRLTA